MTAKKKVISVTIDLDVALRCSIESTKGNMNVSKEVNEFLRRRLEIDNNRTPLEELKANLSNLKSKVAALNQEIALGEAEIVKYSEEDEEQKQKRLKDIQAMNRAIRSSGILRDIR